MLIFDQLKKDDPQLRFLAVLVLAGLLVLLGGLWWIQVVSVKFYQEKLETQSIRTVRIPAVRGRILDREGRPIADNRPSYNVNMYLEALSRNFQTNYATALAQARTNFNSRIKAQEAVLKRKLTPQEKKLLAQNEKNRSTIQQETRYQVSSSIVTELGNRLQCEVSLDPKEFQKRYDKARALPLLIRPNLTPEQVARFEEQSMYTPGMYLDIQSVRYYPNGNSAAHLLGYLQRNSDSSDGEEADYDYRLDDWKGVAGIERVFNTELRGVAGSKSVLVNNLGYRQNETIWAQAEPGKNVVLTIDMDIQKAAEAALQSAGADPRGAVVVMDARNGDILAMASAPNYNPNYFVQHPEPAVYEREKQRWIDEELRPQANRAMQENLAPGSIFKMVVGLAALELGVLNPRDPFPSQGYYIVGNHTFHDKAGPGLYDFSRALARSSNPYFMHQGLKPGVLPKVVALGQKLHLGEKTGLIPGQETRGVFPTPKDISSDSWHDGDTAILSIGQGMINITPVQAAVMIAAIANGGKVFWPRLVSRLETAEGEVVQTFPEGRLRDNLGVSPRNLKIVHEAMMADVESVDGTGHKAAVQGWHIAGKTGTAEVERHGGKDRNAQQTWFASFAPVESPRYVVVATVEGGASGGLTCAPIAHKVYLALQQREQQPHDKRSATRPGTLAQIQ
ncbi:peptidoglycan D,D-transpeptidase FtsI family protein [Pedosphaera parvula]|uniref:Penicillin-binding protein 2 n=1 Tax=Pedosphaera parvula (strain Ellin514) TaxID=320771 RepID=B9XG16_PEDPL|nr:penicillin-binding transpeptidase domain-containing protein [Pedosphaera parvula]EEF61178.1 penicillin-binding protein 2 [Pedosphaera parvula Ellin514]